jgi:3-oxoacyl-[acyl-carrier protein] reductase
VANAFDLSGQVAIVTGGASGIGRACAARLHASGARVAIVDLVAETAAREAASLGEGAIGVAADVTRSRDVDAAVARTEAELGPLDVMVCCAGIAGDSLRTTEISDEEWRRVFAVNCDGVFYCTRAAVRVMIARNYGRIVHIASIAGKEGNPMAAAYSASKAAVIGMTKSFGKDLAETGIRVNCIAPAVIETPILDQMSDEHIAYMKSKIPLGRFGQPDEVAQLVCFLASRELDFATGACFDLSGGRAVY